MDYGSDLTPEAESLARKRRARRRSTSPSAAPHRAPRAAGAPRWCRRGSRRQPGKWKRQAVRRAGHGDGRDAPPAGCSRRSPRTRWPEPLNPPRISTGRPLGSIPTTPPRHCSPRARRCLMGSNWGLIPAPQFPIARRIVLGEQTREGRRKLSFCPSRNEPWADD